MMRSTSIIILALTLLAAIPAQSQQLLNRSLVPNPYSALKTLAGFQPSVIASESEAKIVYDRMPLDIFKAKSECFQRAEHWSYNLSQNSRINSMKVFLFFTTRYQREFDYDWAYHVAPLIPVKMDDGTIQDMVFDPTFTSRPSWLRTDRPVHFDNTPVTIKNWVKYFIYPDIECPLVENFQDYIDYQERHYCYTMIAPMFNYIPLNFTDDVSGKSGSLLSEGSTWYNPSTQTRMNWRSDDLEQMKKGLKSDKR